MTGTPTADQLNNVKQNTVQWDADAHRQVLVDDSGNVIDSSNPLPVLPIDGPVIQQDLEGKGFVAVGTSAVELTFTGKTESIIISSAITNTGIIYVGKSDVASDGSNAVAFLDVGESLVIDYDDSTNAVYVVSDTAAQSVMVGASL